MKKCCGTCGELTGLPSTHEPQFGGCIFGQGRFEHCITEEKCNSASVLVAAGERSRQHLKVELAFTEQICSHGKRDEIRMGH